MDRHILQSVEGVLKFEYSGGAGLEESLCRCSAVALTTDILPLVNITHWDASLAERWEVCCLSVVVCVIGSRFLRVQCWY